MRKFLTCVVLLLCGCNADNKAAEANKNNTVVLLCQGERISRRPDKREPISYLVKFETKSYSRSLQYYDSDKEMFDSNCATKWSTCSLRITEDVVEETRQLGSNENITLARMTDINRRTGRMQEWTWISTFGKELIFDGQCEKAEEPARRAQKF